MDAAHVGGVMNGATDCGEVEDMGANGRGWVRGVASTGRAGLWHRRAAGETAGETAGGVQFRGARLEFASPWPTRAAPGEQRRIHYGCGEGATAAPSRVDRARDPDPQVVMERAQEAEARARAAFVRADALVMEWPMLHRRLMAVRAVRLVVAAAVIGVLLSTLWWLLLVAGVMALARADVQFKQLRAMSGREQRRHTARRRQQRRARRDRRARGSRAQLALRYAARAEAGALYDDAAVAMFRAQLDAALAEVPEALVAVGFVATPVDLPDPRV